MRSAAVTRIPFAIALTAAALAAQGALAADQSAPAPAGNEWIVTLRAGGVATPNFQGSDRYGLFPTGGISFRRANEPWKFSAPDDGFGFAIYDSPAVRFGPVARYTTGRYLSDDHRLFGLDKIKWTVEPGLFLELYPVDNLRARMEIRRGLNGHDGWVGNLGLDWIQRMGSFTLSGGPRMALGDGEYMNTMFGVTPGEAALNGQVIPFKARGGVKSLGASAALSYAWSPEWSTTVQGGYNRLVGDAGDSPITRAFGSKDQFTFGLSAAYSFKTGW